MGQLNDEIQAHQRLPTGFMGLIKLLIGWWHDIARKQQLLTQYNVIMQSIAQHSPNGRRHPELVASSDHRGELTLRTNLLAPPAIRGSLGSLEQQNSMIMHAAYRLGNSLRQIDAAQRQQQVRIDHLILEQEARSREQQEIRQGQQKLTQENQEMRHEQQEMRHEQQEMRHEQQGMSHEQQEMRHEHQEMRYEQQEMKQQIAQLAQIVAQLQAGVWASSAGDERRRPSFATVHGVFAAEEEEYTPSTSAAAQPMARRLSSSGTG
ncbi:MAG: hypothetical protein K0S27_931, partial [Gammaproteobacteria bacterium]|nr:hypothetical protein [Gammaproteobacteria bacterium]